ncbi:MAG: glycosyltransferase family 4 protein [bacterium]
MILHPDLDDPGGVAAYFRKLEAGWHTKAEHFIVGRRVSEKMTRRNVWRIASDYLRYHKRLKSNDYHVVQINPSMDPKSVIRDGVFLLLAKRRGAGVVVFFHGWQKWFEEFLSRRSPGMTIFKRVYGGADAFVVLSRRFEEVLRRWGFEQPIHHEVMVIEDEAIARFDIQASLLRRLGNRQWNILFLSRICKEKGVHEAIETVNILKEKYPEVRLQIAGDGPDLKAARTHVKRMNLAQVSFLGYVGGSEKMRLFEDSHALLNPTWHGEGLPNTVVECMAFGLPVVTRAVGGIQDFFVDSENGFSTLSNDPHVFATLLERLYLDRGLYESISLHNHEQAKSTFLASAAATRMEKIYETVRPTAHLPQEHIRLA